MKLKKYMKLRLFFLAIVAVLSLNGLQAQEVWSLEKCIAYAYENNLQLQLKQLNINSAQINEQQAKDNRLPNLNGSIGYNVSFAGATDPTTFEFSNQRLSYNNLGLISRATVYQGGRLNKLVEKSSLALKSAQIEKAVSKNDISLAIASNYLDALKRSEELQIANNQKKLIAEQKLNTEKLINAGLLPEGDMLEVESNLVGEEVKIISAQNFYDLALLNLKLSLDLDPETNIQLERPPEIEPSLDLIELYNIDEIYNTALTNQPIVEQVKLQKVIADKDLEIEKAARYPTLSLRGELSSNYSSARKTLDTASLEITGFRPIGVVGTDLNAIVNEPIVDFDFNGTPYFAQLDDNFLQFISATLTIPIFNQFQVKNSIENAKLNVKKQEINKKIALQNLNTEIRKAYADAFATGKNYEASNKNVLALRAAYEYAENKFTLGVTTVFELQTAQNALAGAELQAKSNKYDYLFKLKVLDFYLGKPIKF